MSNYNEYAKDLDTAFKNAAETQQKAYTAFETAKAARAAGVQITNEVYPGQKKAKEAELDANYKAAEAELNRVKKEVWPQFRKTRDRLTNNLKAAVQTHKLMNPDELDPNAVTILNSGLATAADLEGMAEKYADNATMQRLIARQADEIAKNTKDNDERRLANLIANKCTTQSEPEILRKWNALTNVSAHYSGEYDRNNEAGVICALSSNWYNNDVQAAINDF